MPIAQPREQGGSRPLLARAATRDTGAIPQEERRGFDCSRTAPRSPRETKGQAYRETRSPCGEGSCC